MAERCQLRTRETRNSKILKTKSLNSAGISIINFANSAWYACTQLANYSMNLNVQLEDHNDVIEMRHIQHSGRQMSSSDTPKQSK